jgi:hypothetical protein
MILKNSKMVCLTAIVGALATGCTVTVAPPVVDVAPPVAVVEVGVPDAYVWDGVEYVGFIGGNYMYLRWLAGVRLSTAGALPRLRTSSSGVAQDRRPQCRTQRTRQSAGAPGRTTRRRAQIIPTQSYFNERLRSLPRGCAVFHALNVRRAYFGSRSA